MTLHHSPDYRIPSVSLHSPPDPNPLNSPFMFVRNHHFSFHFRPSFRPILISLSLFFRAQLIGFGPDRPSLRANLVTQTQELSLRPKISPDFSAEILDQAKKLDVRGPTDRSIES